MIDRLYLPFDENKVQYRITQPFGVAPAAYPASGGHNGIDYGLPIRTPICAALPGLVLRADFNPDGYGRSVWLDHGEVLTIYAHLSRIDVRVGERVSVHEVVGLSGGDPADPYAGRSTGLHLHFEMRLVGAPASDKPGERKYNARDPLPLLRGWEEARMVPIAQGVVEVARTVYTRKRIDGAYKVNQADVLWRGERVWVYAEEDGYLRVSDTFNRWVGSRWVRIAQRYEQQDV